MSGRCSSECPQMSVQVEHQILIQLHKQQQDSGSSDGKPHSPSCHSNFLSPDLLKDIYQTLFFGLKSQSPLGPSTHRSEFERNTKDTSVVLGIFEPHREFDSYPGCVIPAHIWGTLISSFFSSLESFAKSLDSFAKSKYLKFTINMYLDHATIISCTQEKQHFFPTAVPCLVVHSPAWAGASPCK